MNLCLKVLLLSLFAVITGKAAYAQQKDPTWTGIANGVVRDSVHNHVLPFATLAVYKLADSSLVSYQLSNNFGEFHFRDLPFEIPLKIVVTYVGYQGLVQKFIINKKTGGKFDLKNLNLQLLGNELAEVKVTAIAPVRMHGDTLEFNAAAFDMDKNSAGEDLLRKLPGVVVWGDGTITVNGREISSLLVNGKPFFGGNAKVATQNIPKDAIDKVQVYRKVIDPTNLLDSTTEINLKLKKDKGFNYFGKIGAGYGTDNRFEADADMNFFSPLTQFGVAVAANDINKTAKDITALMDNSSYKGVGTSIDYQPDFTVQGTNRTTIGGLIFQHDFTLEPDKFQTNRLTANYFASNIDTTINSNTKTITALGNNTSQNLNAINDHKSSDLSQNLTLAYNRHIGNYTYIIVAAFNTDLNTTMAIQKDSSASSTLGRQSNNIINDLIHVNSERLALSASMSHQKPAGSKDWAPGNWNLDYAFKMGSIKSDTNKIADFVALINPTLSSYYNRMYNANETRFSQRLDARLNDFSNLFFDYRSSVTIGLENDIRINYQDFHNNVSDMDTAINSYVPNQALSVNRNYTVIDDRPGINVSKKFFKHLSGRFQKDATLSASIQAQVYDQKSISDHADQNFNQNYQKFIPKASFTYSNSQYGYFSNQWSVGFVSSYNYPIMEQLYPIVDLSYAYNIETGNPYLKPSHKNELSLSFQHTGLRPKKTFDYSLNAAAGTINDGFAYSNTTDSSGRSTYSFVNLNGFRYANLSGSVKKAYKFGNNQLQFQFAADLNFSKAPGYTQNFTDESPILNYSDNLASNTSLILYYSYLNFLAVNLTEGLNAYSSKQTGLNNTDFESTLQSTQLSASVNCTKRLTLSSNITQNNNTSTGSGTIHFTIWNASAAYRFMKGNNLELKFSALDLLHQNTGIINYGNNIMITHGTVNVLQQYFIFTLSYFPRKFGK